jgi:hypothetical protein
MALQGYWVELVKFSTVKHFIEENHYSHKTRGLKVYKCFGLFVSDTMGFPILLGAIIYTKPSMPGQAKKYNPDNPELCIELARLVCVDDTPKNAESFFIARTIRWLRKNTDMEMIITYADSTQGHVGTVYKASNFTYYGMTGRRLNVMVDGKQYHERALTDYSSPIYDTIRARIKNNDIGIRIVKTQPKYIYYYKLRK